MIWRAWCQSTILIHPYSICFAITLPIVGKDWYQYQICAEPSCLHHLRIGCECIWICCRKKRSALTEGEIFYHSWGSGAILGRGKRVKEEDCVQVRRDGAWANWTQTSALVIKKWWAFDSCSYMNILLSSHNWAAVCFIMGKLVKLVTIHL